ncbi:type II toxin-antitoxin system YafQ family toxin [Candidatus Saccharibacteria bacterium]|nr:type II toxin-antitoxin system YafQ family toxin [Candidatus Saccharibacteria bacterium]
MKYDVRATTKFRKNYKKMQKRGLRREDFEVVLDKLKNGRRLSFRNHDHALTGEYIGFRECHIKPDWLLIYKIEDDILILTLIDTGSHADLFDM